jgi:hypothetical protein
LKKIELIEKHMRKPIRNKQQIDQKSNLNIDTFLSRVSHLSQLGLLAVAIFGYFYTVVPIYEKAQLDKDIAQKSNELSTVRDELSSVKAQLQNNYAHLRNSIVNGYIFNARVRCSGVLRGPTLPPKVGEPPIDELKHYTEVYDIEVFKCLQNSFQKNTSMELLSSNDYIFLYKNILELGVKLTEKGNESMKEYLAFPSKMKLHPELLPQLDADSFTGRSLSLQKQSLSKQEYEDYVFDARFKLGLSTITTNYEKTIQADLSKLRNLDWAEANKK